MPAGTPVVRLQGSSSSDLAAYTTGSASGVGAGKLLLFVASGLSGASLEPSTVTGLGVTWTRLQGGVTPNGNAAGSLWEGTGAASTSGTLTITFAAAMSNASWTLVEVPSTNTVRRSAVDVGAVTNPSVGLSGGASNADSAVLAFMSANVGSAITFTPSHTAIGTRTDLTSPTVSKLGQYDIDAPPSSMSWTTTNASGKVLAIAEAWEVAPGGGPKWWTGSAEETITQTRWWDGSAEVTPTGVTWWNGTSEVALI